MVKKWESCERELTYAYALRLAQQTGVGIGWLLGSGPQSPIMLSSRRWTPGDYLRKQAEQMDASSIEWEAELCRRYFLINMDRLARILLTGIQHKRLQLAESRVAIAFGKIAAELEIPRLDREAAAVSIFLRQAAGKAFMATARAQARQFRIKLDQIVRHRPVSLNAKHATYRARLT